MQMNISARNALKGKVVDVNVGAVNTEVVIELPGGDKVVSIISKDSANKLGLALGKTCYAVIKASHVMVAVD
ncbi:TOBE domain-containing protein [Nitrococcus mobilis]|uniref:Molybdenum-pterin-binding-protein n=1 Tax=Nitrococcus mobilis Nb-231 TaxID=314278 RepID=A4BNW7_9GAMM|nr:TOBE domain-containing protein [Nitrococcus mobilis]EAR22916.1 Molybdenum-pterin-binding-protein [Nitrococcus mobilis Nb-231]